MTQRATRIGFVIPDLRPYGAQRVAIDLANGMSSLGVEVTFITFVGPKLDSAQWIPRGAHHVHLPRPRRGLLGWLWLIMKLRRALQRMPLALGFMHYANVSLILATAFTPTRTLVSEHNIASLAMKDQHAHPALMRMLVGVAYRHADRVIGVSDAVAVDAKKYFHLKQPVLRVYNPVDVERVLSQRNQTPPLHRFFQEGLRNDIVLLVTVGALKPAKGQDLLLQALAVGPSNTRCLIVGDGIWRSHLQAMIDGLGLADRVELVGWQANPLTWMASADCVVVPSRYEGFGLSLVEAALLNAKTVAVGAPGLEEVATLLHLPTVQPDSVSALAHVLGGSFPRSGDSEPAVRRLFNPQTVAGHYLNAMSNPSGQK
jgi:glycosyltransferase involved in cell wall biosynthesis